MSSETLIRDIFNPSDAASAGSARGFPLGYFVIRSIATGKVLDIPQHAVKDGMEVILFDEKENALVENLRKPEADNQVFFIDAFGALASKHSGHAIDVEDGKLVIRHRKPIAPHFPSTTSHALPSFSYDPVSGHVTVTFETDPAYPPTLLHKDRDDFELVESPSTAVANARPAAGKAWKQRTYLLTSIPSQKPKTFIDGATEFLSSSANFIAAPFQSLNLNPFAPSPKREELIDKGEEDARTLDARVSLEHVQAGHFDLLDEEVVEEERSEEAEVDDDPDPMRRVKVVGYRKPTDSPNAKARDRKRWEILPIRKERRRY